MCYLPTISGSANTTASALISDYDCVMHNEIGCCSRKTKRKRLLSCKMEKKEQFIPEFLEIFPSFFRGCYSYPFLPFVVFVMLEHKAKEHLLHLA